MAASASRLIRPVVAVLVLVLRGCRGAAKRGAVLGLQLTMATLVRHARCWSKASISNQPSKWPLLLETCEILRGMKLCQGDELGSTISVASTLCHLTGKSPCPVQIAAGGMFPDEEEESPPTGESSSYFSALCRHRFLQGSNFYSLSPS